MYVSYLCVNDYENCDHDYENGDHDYENAINYLYYSIIYDHDVNDYENEHVQNEEYWPFNVNFHVDDGDDRVHDYANVLFFHSQL